jgi:Tfp pilus assembly protein PilX
MEYGTGGQDLPGVESDPKFLIEEAGTSKSSGLTIGVGARSNYRRFYRITTRAHGKTAVTEVVSDTVYTL